MQDVKGRERRWRRRIHFRRAQALLGAPLERNLEPEGANLIVIDWQLSLRDVGR
jgi:hypothetical protein